MRPNDEQIAELPLYVFPGTETDKDNNRRKVSAQVRELIRQMGGDKHLAIKVSCAECGQPFPLLFSYHCLYCEMFFCKHCAQFHFGKRVPTFAESNA